MPRYGSHYLAVGDIAGVATVMLTNCSECGAYVFNTNEHTRFHEENITFTDLRRVMNFLAEEKGFAS